VPLALALATIPLYIDMVGTERYGALAIAWLILGYFGLFDLGLGRATAQRIAALKDGSDNDRSDVFWTAVIVNIGMGLVGGVILYFAAQYFFTNHFKIADNLRAEVMDAVPYLACAVPIATLTGVASGALQGREKFLEVNVITIIGTSLFQLIPLTVAWLYGPTLKWLIIGAIVARIVGMLIFMVRVHANLLAGITPRFDKSQWVALLKYGGWVTVISVISPLLVVADRFLIGATISAIAVTIYTVPFEMVQRVAVLPRSLGNALFPRMASSTAEQNVRLSSGALDIIGFIVTPVILALLFIMEPFLNIWVGEKIASQATPIGWILLSGYWINSYTTVPYSKLQAIGKPDMIVKALIPQLPIYLAALYYAVSTYGLIGAAFVFSMRVSIDYVIMSYMARQSAIFTKTLFIFGLLIVMTASSLAYIPYFSVMWWVVLVVSFTLYSVAALRNFPKELKTMVEKILPPSVLQIIKFTT